MNQISYYDSSRYNIKEIMTVYTVFCKFHKKFHGIRIQLVLQIG